MQCRCRRGSQPLQGHPEQLAAEWATGKIVMPSPTLGEVMINITAPPGVKVTVIEK
jgi:hypothetical protein